MMVLKCSSSAASIGDLVGKGGGALFLAPSAVKTKKELKFAFYLAQEAFRTKENISKKPANEAVLFLACETNFTSAAKKIGARSARDFVLVSQKKIPLARLKKELLLTSAKPLKLPEWGRKRGHYSEGELAVEKMALARIRN